MSSRKQNPASLPDDENPEWSEKDFADGRPALDVIAETFGSGVAEMLKQRRGRPPKETARKVNQTLRLDPDVLEAYRMEGSGWQVRINQVLRQHMPHRGK